VSPPGDREGGANPKGKKAASENSSFGLKVEPLFENHFSRGTFMKSFTHLPTSKTTSKKNRSFVALLALGFLLQGVPAIADENQNLPQPVDGIHTYKWGKGLLPVPVKSRSGDGDQYRVCKQTLHDAASKALAEAKELREQYEEEAGKPYDQEIRNTHLGTGLGGGACALGVLASWVTAGVSLDLCAGLLIGPMLDHGANNAGKAEAEKPIPSEKEAHLADLARRIDALEAEGLAERMVLREIYSPKLTEANYWQIEGKDNVQSFNKILAALVVGTPTNTLWLDDDSWRQRVANRFGSCEGGKVPSFQDVLEEGGKEAVRYFEEVNREYRRLDGKDVFTIKRPDQPEGLAEAPAPASAPAHEDAATEAKQAN
jgi:hypothetical protein